MGKRELTVKEMFDRQTKRPVTGASNDSGRYGHERCWFQHEHTCIICEHGGHQVDQTHACMCGAECEQEEWRTP